MARTAAIGFWRAPAPHADGHAAAELADEFGQGDSLVCHGLLSGPSLRRRGSRRRFLLTIYLVASVVAPAYLVVSASRFSTKAERCSSATPATWSSQVNPCSNR